MDLLQNRENTFNYLLDLLRRHDTDLNIVTDIKRVGGGSINEAFQICTNKTSYFLKVNSAEAFPGMFEAEARGLKILSDSNTFVIPEVFEVLEWKGLSGLVLSFVESGEKGNDFNLEFARKLAALHAIANCKFGLDHSNFIGSLVQKNDFRDSWTEFYAELRIEPLFKIAFDSGKFSKSPQKKVSNLLSKLESLLPLEPPSLLHGDLWSGNYMINKKGKAVLVDPAVYFGHREMDLAMMKLFGGFSTDIFRIYNDVYPLEKDWERRIEIHQLYPLLVHVVLFGGSYVQQFNRIVDQYN